MKTITLTLFILQLFLARNAYSQTFNLTVSGGYGSGTYSEGDTVHVWSRAVFGDSVFVGWVGSGVQYLTFADEWHTTLIVPAGTGAGALGLEAKFDVIPEGSRIDSTDYFLFGINNGNELRVEKRVLFAIPPEPKGLVFLLHGTNGSGRSFFDKYDRFSIVKDLLYNGYAAVALDANEQTLGDQNGDDKLRWYALNASTANADNNIDIKNIAALRDSMIADFSLPADIVSFSLGMSNGAVFSDICAAALGFNASAHVTAKGRTGTYLRDDITPVIWIMSENDQNENADNDGAYSNYTLMSNRQKTEWHWFRRSPAYPQRFVRSLNDISPAQSDSVFQRLKDGGYLRDDNFLTYLRTDSIPVSFLNGLRFTRSQVIDIFLQLRMINAEHVLHSDFSKNIIRFFDETLMPTAVHSPAATFPEKFSITAWPNPFRETTTIAIDNPVNSRFTLTLYNLLGQAVRRFEDVSGSRFRIERHGLANGVYFLQITAQGKSIALGKVMIR